MTLLINLLPSWLQISDIVLIGAFVVVFVLFLFDFNITSRRSWVLLLGFLGLGGLSIWRVLRRRELLAELEAREKKLQELEKRYEELGRHAAVTREAYENAKKELEQAKLEVAQSIARADGELQEELARIETESTNLSVDESVERIRAALRN